MQRSSKTSPLHPKNVSDADACPSDDVVATFLNEKLPPDAATAIAAHVDTCKLCQAKIENSLSRATWSEQLFLSDEPLSTDVSDTIRLTASGRLDTNVSAALPADELVTAFRPSVQPGCVLSGRFELRQLIGMGGCGTVFAAWDQQLRREVAIKVPHWQLCETPSVRKRLGVEGRAAARLSHPGIVPVFEACNDEFGNCFLVSELVRGPSLSTWLKPQLQPGKGIPVRQAAQIVAQLAVGVEYAHASGVLHRDLKPANILLAPASAGSLPFTPRITDFGLARLSEDATLTTTEGSIFGSLHYMAPEQAVGRLDVGPACDVYALGTMLYEMLTGCLPINSGTPTTVLQAIPVQPVVAPRQRCADVPADLEAVCLKCLEKRPQDRYQTAGELASDLQQFLKGAAVTARLPTRRERAIRWIRRHPEVTAVLTTVTIAVLMVVGVLVQSNRRQAQYISEIDQFNQRLESSNASLGESLRTSDDLRSEAEAMRRQAEEQWHATQEGLYVSEIRRAFQAWHERDLPELQQILNRVDQPAFQSFRGIECDWLWTHLIRPHRELTRFPGAAYSAAFSPSGELVAAAGRDAVVRIVRYHDAMQIAEWPTRQGETNAVIFSADGASLWTSGDDGSVCKWDVESGTELLRIPAHAPEQAHNLYLVPGSDTLISTGTEGRILLWDSVTGKARGALLHHHRAVTSLAIDPDGKRLYSASRDGTICLWNLTDFSLQDTWTVPHDYARELLLSRDGRWLLSSLARRRLEFRETSSGEVAESLELLDNFGTLLQDPNHATVYAVDVRGGVYEIAMPKNITSATDSTPGDDTLSKGKARGLGPMNPTRTYQCGLSPDGTLIVSVAADGSVTSWPIATLNADVGATAVAAEIKQACIESHGQTLVTSDGHDLTRWSTVTLEQLQRIDIPGRSISSFASLPGGDLLTAEVDDLQRGWLVRRQAGDLQPVVEHFSGKVERSFTVVRPDAGLNRILFLNWGTPEICFSTLDPLETLSPLRLPGNSGTLAVDCSNSRFAHSDGQRVSVREIISRNLCWSEPQSDSVSWMRFSRDGKFLVVSTNDRVLRTWDAATGLPLKTMSGHRSPVCAGVMSADGRTLFSGGSNGELRVWHLTTGEMLGAIDLQSTAGIKDLMLTPDDERLFVRLDDRTVQMIPLKPHVTP